MLDFVLLLSGDLEAFAEDGRAFSRFSRPFEIVAGIFRGRAPRVEGNDHLCASRVEQVGQGDGFDIEGDLREVAHQQVAHSFVLIRAARVGYVLADAGDFALCGGQAVLQVFCQILLLPLTRFCLHFSRSDICDGSAQG